MVIGDEAQFELINSRVDGMTRSVPTLLVEVEVTRSKGLWTASAK
jgi:hypothetical protein